MFLVCNQLYIIAIDFSSVKNVLVIANLFIVDIREKTNILRLSKNGFIECVTIKPNRWSCNINYIIVMHDGATWYEYSWIRVGTSLVKYNKMSWCVIICFYFESGHCLLFTTGKWREEDGMFEVRWSSTSFCSFPLFTAIFLFSASTLQIYRYESVCSLIIE